MAHSKPVLIVHGGAWEIPDSEVEDHLRGMNAALEKGWSLLVEGASALNVVEETVVVMENDPTFDAGKGSILNTDGSVEMDASIMDGKTLEAGAVAALRNFLNPICIARRVLGKTEHILLAGEGCEAFARKQGFQSVSIEELLTPRELKRLAMLIKDKKFQTPHAFGKERGTVGAVAVDQSMNVAAATSTGGTPKKIPGRVGDSALIGCGTYAENGVGGVSCTGWGESIIKVMLAREVIEQMRSGSDAKTAARQGIQKLADKFNGLGGVICLNEEGQVGMAYNTPRMAWGYMRGGMNKSFVAVE